MRLYCIAALMGMALVACTPAAPPAEPDAGRHHDAGAGDAGHDGGQAIDAGWDADAGVIEIDAGLFDPCTPNPCILPHEDECIPDGARHTCTCEDGYTRDPQTMLCEPIASACASNPCMDPNRGVCVDQDGQATCHCDPGFHLEDDACVSDDPCTPNPCQEANRGVCTAEDGDATCHCDPGFVLENAVCVPADPCEPNPCQDANRSVCTAADGMAVCGCDPGFTLQDGACTPDVVTVCSGQHADGDTLEPNECLMLSRAAGFGTPALNASLWPAGDVDWYNVPASAGHIVRATVHGMAAHVSLFDAQGERLAEADGAVAAVSPVSGVVHVRVRALTMAQTGDYTLDIVDEGLDDHGGTPETATQLPPEASVQASGIVQFAGDVDAFSFEGIAGHVFRVRETNRTFDAHLTIADPSGAILAQTLSETWAAPVSAGTYTVHVARAGGTADFALAVDDLGPDDHGNVAPAATAYTFGTDLDVHVQYPGDVDMLRVTLPAGHVLRVRERSVNINVQLALYDDAGALLEESTTERLTWFAQEAGTYTLAVSTAGQTGACDLSMVDLGPDDHGNTRASGTLVDWTTSIRAEITYAGDRDVLLVDVPAGTDLRVRESGIALDALLWIYGPDDEVLIGGYEDITMRFSDGGRYAVAVRAADGVSTAAASIAFELDQAPDDHGSLPADGTSLVTDRVVTGQIEQLADIDYFRFDATAGERVVLRTSTGAPFTPPHSTLLGPDGAVRAEAEGGVFMDAIHDFTAPSTGEYVLKVRMVSTTAAAPYTVRLTRP